MDREALADLMSEAALIVGAGELIEQPKAGWMLREGASGNVVISSDDAVSRVVLSRDLGPLSQHNRVRACEMLLALNLAWPAHGGLWASRDPERDEVVLSLDVPLQGLTRQTLTNVLRNFLAAAQAWAEALGGFSARDDDPSLSPLGHDWIRI